jgi:DNA-binding transcriptional ArsR family regulator
MEMAGGDAAGAGTPDLAALEEKAAAAARLLRLLANEKRLLLLCHLAAEGEVAAGRLAALLGLSQPALSQHLAMLREDGLVATRRQSQAVLYRLADPMAARLLALLHDLYCAPQAGDTTTRSRPC